MWCPPKRHWPLKQDTSALTASEFPASLIIIEGVLLDTSSRCWILIEELPEMIFKYFSSFFFTVYADIGQFSACFTSCFLWFWSGLQASVLTRWISDIKDAWVLNIKSQSTKERLKIRFNLPASWSVCVYGDSYRETQKWDFFFKINHHLAIKHLLIYCFYYILN